MFLVGFPVGSERSGTSKAITDLEQAISQMHGLHARMDADTLEADNRTLSSNDNDCERPSLLDPVVEAYVCPDNGCEIPTSRDPAANALVCLEDDGERFSSLDPVVGAFVCLDDMIGRLYMLQAQAEVRYGGSESGGSTTAGGSMGSSRSSIVAGGNSVGGVGGVSRGTAGGSMRSTSHSMAGQNSVGGARGVRHHTFGDFAEDKSAAGDSSSLDGGSVRSTRNKVAGGITVAGVAGASGGFGGVSVSFGGVSNGGASSSELAGSPFPFLSALLPQAALEGRISGAGNFSETQSRQLSELGAAISSVCCSRATSLGGSAAQEDWTQIQDVLDQAQVLAVQMLAIQPTSPTSSDGGAPPATPAAAPAPHPSLKYMDWTGADDRGELAAGGQGGSSDGGVKREAVIRPSVMPYAEGLFETVSRSSVGEDAQAASRAMEELMAARFDVQAASRAMEELMAARFAEVLRRTIPDLTLATRAGPERMLMTLHVSSQSSQEELGELDLVQPSSMVAVVAEVPAAYFVELPLEDQSDGGAVESQDNDGAFPTLPSSQHATTRFLPAPPAESQPRKLTYAEVLRGVDRSLALLEEQEAAAGDCDTIAACGADPCGDAAHGAVVHLNSIRRDGLIEAHLLKCGAPNEVHVDETMALVCHVTSKVHSVLPHLTSRAEGMKSEGGASARGRWSASAARSYVQSEGGVIQGTSIPLDIQETAHAEAGERADNQRMAMLIEDLQLTCTALEPISTALAALPRRGSLPSVWGPRPELVAPTAPLDRVLGTAADDDCALALLLQKRASMLTDSLLHLQELQRTFPAADKQVGATPYPQQMHKSVDVVILHCTAVDGVVQEVLHRAASRRTTALSSGGACTSSCTSSRMPSTAGAGPSWSPPFAGNAHTSLGGSSMASTIYFLTPMSSAGSASNIGLASMGGVPSSGVSSAGGARPLPLSVGGSSTVVVSSAGDAMSGTPSVGGASTVVRSAGSAMSGTSSVGGASTVVSSAGGIMSIGPSGGGASTVVMSSAGGATSQPPSVGWASEGGASTIPYQVSGATPNAASVGGAPTAAMSAGGASTIPNQANGATPNATSVGGAPTAVMSAGGASTVPYSESVELSHPPPASGRATTPFSAGGVSTVTYSAGGASTVAYSEVPSDSEGGSSSFLHSADGASSITLSNRSATRWSLPSAGEESTMTSYGGGAPPTFQSAGGASNASFSYGGAAPPYDGSYGGSFPSALGTSTMTSHGGTAPLPHQSAGGASNASFSYGGDAPPSFSLAGVASTMTSYGGAEPATLQSARGASNASFSYGGAAPPSFHSAGGVSTMSSYGGAAPPSFPSAGGVSTTTNLAVGVSTQQQLVGSTYADMAAPFSAAWSTGGASTIATSQGGASVRDQSVSGAPVLQHSMGGASVRDQSVGGAPVLQHSMGGASVRDQSVGGAPVLQHSMGGASVRDQSVGGAPVLQHSMGGASVRDQSVGGAPVLQHSMGGASVRDQSVGGAPVLQHSMGGASVRDQSVGGAPLVQPSMGGASSLQQSVGGASMVIHSMGGMSSLEHSLGGASLTVPSDCGAPYGQPLENSPPLSHTPHGFSPSMPNKLLYYSPAAPNLSLYGTPSTTSSGYSPGKEVYDPSEQQPSPDAADMAVVAPKVLFNNNPLYYTLASGRSTTSSLGGAPPGSKENSEPLPTALQLTATANILECALEGGGSTLKPLSSAGSGASVGSEASLPLLLPQHDAGDPFLLLHGGLGERGSWLSSEGGWSGVDPSMLRFAEGSDGGFSPNVCHDAALLSTNMASPSPAKSGIAVNTGGSGGGSSIAHAASQGGSKSICPAPKQSGSSNSLAGSINQSGDSLAQPDPKVDAMVKSRSNSYVVSASNPGTPRGGSWCEAAADLNDPVGGSERKTRRPSLTQSENRKLTYSTPGSAPNSASKLPAAGSHSSSTSNTFTGPAAAAARVRARLAQEAVAKKAEAEAAEAAAEAKRAKMAALGVALGSRLSSPAYNTTRKTGLSPMPSPSSSAKKPASAKAGTPSFLDRLEGKLAAKQQAATSHVKPATPLRLSRIPATPGSAYHTPGSKFATPTSSHLPAAPTPGKTLSDPPTPGVDSPTPISKFATPVGSPPTPGPWKGQNHKTAAADLTGWPRPPGTEVPEPARASAGDAVHVTKDIAPLAEIPLEVKGLGMNGEVPEKNETVLLNAQMSCGGALTGVAASAQTMRLNALAAGAERAATVPLESPTLSVAGAPSEADLLHSESSGQEPGLLSDISPVKDTGPLVPGRRLEGGVKLSSVGDAAEVGAKTPKKGGGLTRKLSATLKKMWGS
eukprot:gene2947-12954_t